MKVIHKLSIAKLFFYVTLSSNGETLMVEMLDLLRTYETLWSHGIAMAWITGASKSKLEEVKYREQDNILTGNTIR